MVAEQLGTVVSTMEGPSPSKLSFVVNNGKVHKGMFVELEYSEGTMMCLVEELMKTNRYFERPDSVKAIGPELEKNFPVAEWEFLLAQARPLGVFKDNFVNRPTFPPSPGTKVFVADNERIKKFLGLPDDGLNLGSLQFHDVLLKANLSKLLQKHLAIVATSGAGKCLTPDHKIQLADGSFVRIGALVDSKMDNARVLVDGIEYAVNESDLKVMALDASNHLVPSKVNVFARRKSPEEIISVKTWSGREINSTLEHLIPIFDGKVSWRSASELKENDFLLVPRITLNGAPQLIDISSFCFDKNAFVKDGLLFSKKKPSKKGVSLKLAVSKEFARFFAYLLAEGHNFGGGFSFSNYSDLLQSDFEKCMLSVLNDVPKKSKQGGEVRYYNKALMGAFAKLGFTNSSWTKFVPQEVLKSEEAVLVEFLSAFIDCDGYVADKGLEITLASKELIEGLEAIFFKLGVVPYLRQKTVKGKTYTRLLVTGAKNMGILSKKLNLLIDYKKSALDLLALKNPNTNVDVVPNLPQKIGLIVNSLRLTGAMAKNLESYYSGRMNPSVDSLKELIVSFENRVCEVSSAVCEAKELFFSLPNFSETDALQVLREHYGSVDFNQMSEGIAVSSTTARRVVRGITSPTKKTFVLANNCLSLSGQEDFGIKRIAELDVRATAQKLIVLCNEFGLDQSAICAASGLNLRELYSLASQESCLVYSNLYSIAKQVYIEAVKTSDALPEIIKEITFLKEIAGAGIFFDRIISVEKKKSECEYVYDLSVEHSNFVANNLVVHNSYFVSVLLEELLSRKPEQGQIGVVVIDTHGEYTCFGEPVKQGEKYLDFSAKTRIVDGAKIKIACSKLTVHMISSISELSPSQKREMSKILQRLSAEMKSGAGPFDLNAVRAEIESIDNEKTAASLYSVVSDLEEMHLFGKIDEPSVVEMVKPGEMVVINLNDVTSEKKKHIIVGYLSNKLFHERRSASKKIPPFTLFVEEAHNFIPEGIAAEHATARSYLRTIAREGRKFGASLVVISQRPKRLDTTTLANCNSNVILRVTNPYDLKHISESCEALDNSSMGIISSLRVGEALIVGEAVGAPTFFKVRQRKSAPNKHEVTLEESARRYQSDTLKKSSDADAFL